MNQADLKLPSEARWILRIPLIRQRLGLGDVVEHVTRKIGLTPCGGCQKRKILLNQVVLEPTE